MIEIRVLGKDGKWKANPIYAWIGHDKICHDKDCDGDPSKRCIPRGMHDEDIKAALAEDTRKRGHNENGLTIDDVVFNASHMTIAKIYPSVETYLNGDSKPLKIGVAVCSLKDQFSRKRGRTIAIGRALTKLMFTLHEDKDGLFAQEWEMENV